MSFIPTTPMAEDWAGQYEAVTGKKRKKKKKRSDAVTDPYQAGSTTTAPTAFPPQGQGVGRTTAPPSQSVSPGQYQPGIADDIQNASPGSLASGLWGPEGIGSVAGNPQALADLYFGRNYGLGPGSNSAMLSNYYLNPQEKMYGLLGSDTPLTNTENVAFGEQLMSQARGMGMQLNPRSMMTTLLKTVAQEAQSTAAGGDSATGAYNPLSELAHDPDPYSALNGFISIVRGALRGTMPEDSLNSYLNYLQRVGSQFAAQWVQQDPARMEAAGNNFATFLIGKLGPTGGL